MMISNVDEDQRVRELFDARFTVNEILERTGLTIEQYCEGDKRSQSSERFTRHEVTAVNLKSSHLASRQDDPHGLIQAPIKDVQH